LETVELENQFIVRGRGFADERDEIADQAGGLEKVTAGETEGHFGGEAG